jgi:hypothetical protein
MNNYVVISASILLDIGTFVELLAAYSRVCTLLKQEKLPRATKLTLLRPLYGVMVYVERPLVEQVRWLYDGGPTF